MSAVSIGWDETAPADSRNAGLGASDIRSILSNIRGGLGAEHVWPTSAGNAGVHKPGSAVAFYGTASQVSSSDTDGRIMVTSDSTNLYAVHSAVTTLIGGRYAVFGEKSYLQADTSVLTSKVTQHWLLQTGVSVMSTGTVGSLITFTTTYLQAPSLTLSMELSSSDVTGWGHGPVGLSPAVTGATIWNRKMSSGATEAPPVAYKVNWIAAGFVANG